MLTLFFNIHSHLHSPLSDQYQKIANFCDVVTAGGATAVAPAEGKLTAEELESTRRAKYINCFNAE